MSVLGQYQYQQNLKIIIIKFQRVQRIYLEKEIVMGIIKKIKN
jgi:hypothetical protein